MPFRRAKMQKKAMVSDTDSDKAFPGIFRFILFPERNIYFPNSNYHPRFSPYFSPHFCIKNVGFCPFIFLITTERSVILLVFFREKPFDFPLFATAFLPHFRGGFGRNFVCFFHLFFKVLFSHFCRIL